MSKLQRHQWTNGGSEVLLVKCVEKDGSSYDGFKWPLIVGAVVEAPDWNERTKCGGGGGGLHGWPLGFCLGEGKEPNWLGVWLVFAADPKEVIDVGNKAKVRRATIRYVGTWQGATNFVLDGQMAFVHRSSRGASSATGTRGASSATGDYGASSATGTRGASSATGDCSVAVVTGADGSARGGAYSVIALAYFSRRAGRYEMRAAEIGTGDGKNGKLKANCWYVINSNGEFVEADD